MEAKREIRILKNQKAEVSQDITLPDLSQVVSEDDNTVKKSEEVLSSDDMTEAIISSASKANQIPRLLYHVTIYIDIMENVGLQYDQNLFQTAKNILLALKENKFMCETT